VPALSVDPPDFEIVAIARRPGVLSKVAVRPRSPDIAGSVSPGIGADHLARVSQQLDGERIQMVRWQRSASGYITDALGLADVPPMTLLPALGHARVLLGGIDVRGIAGWRGLNVILASALTGWRIRLEPVAATAAWAALQRAMLTHRSVVGVVVGRTRQGMRVELNGLYAGFRRPARERAVGEEVELRITRMNPDEGRIFVSDHLPDSGQLQLI
jgi:transcription antitermination factor NusA-like protein